LDVDHGQLVYPSLKDCPVVMALHELSAVDRRATGRQDWRRAGGLLIRVIRITAASRGMLARRMSTDRIPASRGIASLADIPFCHVPSRPA